MILFLAFSKYSVIIDVKIEELPEMQPGTVNMHRPADTANRATASSALHF